ncbi:retinol-binding protein pinta-like isoform X2 [Formica exsecta]|uniref:retinol-binding protein pinta-like isoform X2 n=1 Tax=Formica exsecta TaxID=72781 RepID=UPI001144809B|nr:retinol-binding protein pinta-like isoform X2 [Formica exsecta]
MGFSISTLAIIAMTDTRSWHGDNSDVQCQYELTSKDKEYAAVHLNETDENREKAIAEIKRWIENSDDLYGRTDDFFILQFLRTCKFNIEKTKIRMRNYYQQRHDLPEWSTNRNPFLPEMQELLNLGVFLFLRKLDNQGRMVLIIRQKQQNPDVQKLLDLVKIGIMIMDVITKVYVPLSLYGITLFIDLDGVTARYLKQLHPRIVMNIVHAWQGCYPIRLRSINYINAPMYVHIGISIFKHFMNEKLKQRLHVYTPNETKMHKCFEDIPADIRPLEYGGTDSTAQEIAEHTKKLVEKYHDWFIDDEKYKIISKQVIGDKSQLNDNSTNKQK